jgi:Fic family protein
MMTLRRFSQGLDAIHTGTAWYLADLGRAMGRQELFARQSPQRLKALREHALVESAVSSNRIEGVEVEPRRVATLVFGRPSLRDRNEEEVRGYRDALKLIHEKAGNLPISPETVCQLHRLTRGEIWDAGRYKEQDGEIIEKFDFRNQLKKLEECGFGPFPPPRR